jgi:hypothetical protein
MISQRMKFVILPTFILSALLFLSMFIFYWVGNSTISFIMVENREWAKTVKNLAIIPQVLFAIALFFASKHPFEKVFKYTLLILMAIVTVLSGILPFAKIHSLYYTIVQLLNFNLGYLFVWGFINRVSNLSDGLKDYIPLAFILEFVASIASYFVFGVVLSLMTLIEPDFGKHLTSLTVYIN